MAMPNICESLSKPINMPELTKVLVASLTTEQNVDRMAQSSFDEVWHDGELSIQDFTQKLGLGSFVWLNIFLSTRTDVPMNVMQFKAGLQNYCEIKGINENLKGNWADSFYTFIKTATTTRNAALLQRSGTIENILADGLITKEEIVGEKSDKCIGADERVWFLFGEQDFPMMKETCQRAFKVYLEGKDTKKEWTSDLISFGAFLGKNISKAKAEEVLRDGVITKSEILEDLELGDGAWRALGSSKKYSRYQFIDVLKKAGMSAE